MPTFSSLFQQLGMGYQCVIGETKLNVTTKFGPKNIVTVLHAGQAYDWFLSPDRFTTLFNGISKGDTVEITSVKNGQRTEYTMKKVSDATPQSVAKVQQVADDKNKEQELLQNRISIAGFTQALINSGGHDIQACKTLALELVRWSKQQSKALYDEEHQP